MKIGKKIKAIRQEKRFSQTYLGEQLDISQDAISRMESDLTPLTINKLEQLAEIFGMSIDDILHYGEEKILSIEDKQQLNSLQARIVELESIIKDKEMIIALLTKDKN